MKRNNIKIYAVSIVVMMMAIIAGCSKTKPTAKAPVPVKVVVVSQYNGPETIKYSGNILPATTVPLAFKVGGYIDRITSIKGADGRIREINEGDTVSKGMLLAKIRDIDFRTKLNQAKSQIDQAQAGVDKATKDFNRAKSLYESQSLTKTDYDAAKAQYDALNAKLNEAQAGLNASIGKLSGAKSLYAEAENAYRDSELRSSMKGIIIKKMIESGSLVGPGTPGFVVADLSTVKVSFGVPDYMMKDLKPGMEQIVTTQSLPGMEFKGKITKLSPAADAQSRVFDTEISIPNSLNLLKAGMIATVEIRTKSLPQPVIVVPLTAIVRDKDNPEGYAVFIATQENGKTTVHARNVVLGETYDNNVVITSGLELNEKVITSGSSIVIDGDVVTIQ